MRHPTSRRWAFPTALLIVLIALSLAGCARASGAITIEIKTTDAGIGYTLHKRGYYSDMEAMTPEQIEAWLRETMKKVGDREPIFIYADARTSFRAVLEMLRRFKAAGVKRFTVCTGTEADVQPAFHSSFDDLHLHAPKATPAPR